MSVDPVRTLAKVILSLNAAQVIHLRQLLTEEGGGDYAGVAAVIPPNLPLKEDGVALPFQDWPEDYWESQT